MGSDPRISVKLQKRFFYAEDINLCSDNRHYRKQSRFDQLVTMGEVVRRGRCAAARRSPWQRAAGPYIGSQTDRTHTIGEFRFALESGHLSPSSKWTQASQLFQVTFSVLTSRYIRTNSAVSATFGSHSG